MLLKIWKRISGALLSRAFVSRDIYATSVPLSAVSKTMRLQRIARTGSPDRDETRDVVGIAMIAS